MQRQRSFEEELRHVSQQIAQPRYEITIRTKLFPFLCLFHKSLTDTDTFEYCHRSIKTHSGSLALELLLGIHVVSVGDTQALPVHAPRANLYQKRKRNSPFPSCLSPPVLQSKSQCKAAFIWQLVLFTCKWSKICVALGLALKQLEKLKVEKLICRNLHVHHGRAKKLSDKWHFLLSFLPSFFLSFFLSLFFSFFLSSFLPSFLSFFFVNSENGVSPQSFFNSGLFQNLRVNSRYNNCTIVLHLWGRIKSESHIYVSHFTRAFFL